MKTGIQRTLALVLISAFPTTTCADGGTLQFSERRSGMTISLFTSPAPLRVGQIDFSVLVQPLSDDLPVQVYVSRDADPSQRLGGQATNAAATNKLFRAIQLELPEPGRWRVEVAVAGAEPIICEIEVGPSLPAWLELAAWIGWPSIAVALFAIHQWLVARSRKCRKAVIAPTS